MEWFYREMRRKTGHLMMEGNKPAGGKWNYDHDNRKAATKDHAQLRRPAPVRTRRRHRPRSGTSSRRRFGEQFRHASARFGLPQRGIEAVRRLAITFVASGSLHEFGDYQDAMLAE